MSLLGFSLCKALTSLDQPKKQFIKPINIGHTSRLSNPCWHPPIQEPRHTQTTNTHPDHSVDKDGVNDQALLLPSSAMWESAGLAEPCGFSNQAEKAN